MNKIQEKEYVPIINAILITSNIIMGYKNV